MALGLFMVPETEAQQAAAAANFDLGGSTNTFIPPPQGAFGSGYVPPSGGGGFIPPFLNTPAVQDPLPPVPCRLYSALLPASADINDPVAAFRSLDARTQSAFENAARAWQVKFPHAPPAIYSLGTLSRSPVNPKYYLVLSRPMTQYDPRLDSYPLLRAGTANAKVFQAGLRLFFPDMVLDAHTGQNFDHPDQGSMTVDGPFPTTEKYVSEAMVARAVDIINTTPDLFQPLQETSAWNFDFKRSFLTGIQAGVATKNPYVAAGAAVATVVVDAFKGLFNWLGGGNPPPAWLTKLLVMKQLRGDTWPSGAPSFGTSFQMGGSYLNNPYGCHLAIITPTPGGKWDVTDGYLEVMRRLSGGKSLSGWKLWLLVAVGAGGVYYLTSRE